HRPLCDRVPSVRSGGLRKPGHVSPSKFPDVPAYCFEVDRELDSAGGTGRRPLEAYERKAGRAGQLIVTRRPLKSPRAHRRRHYIPKKPAELTLSRGLAPEDCRTGLYDATHCHAAMRLIGNQGYEGSAQAAGARAEVPPCTAADDRLRVRVDCLRPQAAPRLRNLRLRATRMTSTPTAACQVDDSCHSG